MRSDGVRAAPQHPLHGARRAGHGADLERRHLDPHGGGPIGGSSACARWSFQPLSEPKELIDHYADSQQHQHHGDGGTHSLIILLGRIIPRGGLRTDLF